MTLTTILAALGSIATIAGAIFGVFKYIAWRASKAPAQINQSIDTKVESEQSSTDKGGRPQW